MTANLRITAINLILNKMRKEIVIGTTFWMDRKLWKVTTDGDNGYVGIECQDRNKAFFCMKAEEVMECLDKNKLK